MIHPKILIIEDKEEDASELEYFLTKNSYEVTAIASNLKDALGYFYSQQPDLIVADIYLDGSPDGITFAERLQENPNTARPIIFLTSHTDVETFTQAKLTLPFSYLIKPFNELELQYAIELAIEKFGGATGALTTQTKTGVILEKDLFVKSGKTLMKVPIGSIDMVEVEGKYCKIITEDNSYLVQQSLKFMEEKLLSSNFVRIHRNYIINVGTINKFHLTDNELSLNNQRILPVSASFKDNLLKRLDILK